MNNLPATFHYGRCPSCGKIIPVPAGVNKIHCCYCGESFLAQAAITFYGYQKPLSLSEYRPGPVKDFEKQKPELQIQLTPSVPKMMTIKEFANATGLSETATRRLVKEGRIPAIKIGVKCLINYTKVCELIDQGQLG